MADAPRLTTPARDDDFDYDNLSDAIFFDLNIDMIAHTVLTDNHPGWIGDEPFHSQPISAPSQRVHGFSPTNKSKPLLRVNKPWLTSVLPLMHCLYHRTAHFRLRTGPTLLGTDGRLDAEDLAHQNFAFFSRLLGFNFDIRDMGYLTFAGINNRVSDDQWSQPLGDLTTRFDACDRWDAGGWVRAYGVACGVLPNEETRLIKEWKYTRRIPSYESFTAIRDTCTKVGPSPMLKQYCLNLIAMYGLFHLAEDNTLGLILMIGK